MGLRLKSTIAAAVAAVAAHGSVVLEVSPTTYDSLLSSGTVVSGTVTTVQDGAIHALDFGENGYLVLPDYTFSHETFTIEASFKLDRYSQSGPHISALLSAVYWTGSYTQGIDFRVGGGYLYPVLPEEAYTSTENFVKPDGFTRVVRAQLSQSVPAFVLGGENAGYAWKEAYAKHGLMLNEWVHVVAVWDGTDQHIYINGLEATDPWRINGEEFLANIDSQVQFTVGASFENGSRHFDGKAQFIRLHDGALTAEEVASAYSRLDGDMCRCRLRVRTPLAGQGGNAGTEFSLDVSTSASCNIPSDHPVLLKVEFLGETGLLDEIASVTTDKLTFRIEDLLPEGVALPDGVVHVRLHCQSQSGPAKAVASASSDSRSVVMPILFADGATQPVAPVPPTPEAANSAGRGTRGNGISYDLRGRTMNRADQYMGTRRDASGIVFIGEDGKLRATVSTR